MTSSTVFSDYRKILAPLLNDLSEKQALDSSTDCTVTNWLHELRNTAKRLHKLRKKAKYKKHRTHIIVWIQQFELVTCINVSLPFNDSARRIFFIPTWKAQHISHRILEILLIGTCNTWQQRKMPKLTVSQSTMSVHKRITTQTGWRVQSLTPKKKKKTR